MRGVTFVSVTQQFNTTTSMGRLMLNVLLSFAQFDREVTGERIRDKIAAAKKKGLWMGGTPPIGYELKGKKLLVNKTQAQVVRHIMMTPWSIFFPCDVFNRGSRCSVTRLCPPRDKPLRDWKP